MVSLKHDMPEGFFDEEVRNGFTITKKRKEIWAVELDMLLELDRVCKELDICYYLDSGTLLGAVRDGHFIPWDDDIDVVMLREDYDKLGEKGPSMIKHPLFFQSPFTDIGYSRGHSQIRNSQTTAIIPCDLGRERFNQGIFIDIFPLDGVNEETIDDQMILYKKYRRYCGYLKHPESVKAFKTKVKLLWLRLRYRNIPGIYRQIEELFRKNTNTEYIDLLTYRQKKEKEKWLKREWYEEAAKVSFEGFEFPVPKRYDDVLRTCYGDDYLIPKQIQCDHGLFGEIIFDTDKPYLDYIK